MMVLKNPVKYGQKLSKMQKKKKLNAQKQSKMAKNGHDCQQWFKKKTVNNGQKH